jgi:glycosyltransferase involved in cell wall biosynthesis
MKMLIIPSWYPSEYHTWGGFFRDQAEALTTEGQDVAVLFPVLYSPKWILKKKKIILGQRIKTEAGVPSFLRYLPKTHIASWDRKRNLKAAKKLFRQYVDQKGLPDIVHLHSYSNGTIAQWIQKEYGIPYIVTEHFSELVTGNTKAKKRALAAQVYANSQGNFAVSRWFADQLQRNFDVPFDVIPNVVNTQSFPFQEPTKKQGKRFLFVGDLSQKKSPDLILEAFTLFQKNEPDAHLSFVGTGPLAKALQQKAKEEKLQNIVFLGYLNREALLQQYKDHDFLISASPVETFGVVAIEAMSVGRPVLCTESGGISEIVRKHQSGIVVPERSAESLAQGMSEISQKLWESKALSNLAQENYSPKSIVKKTTYSI